ncbi:MULTISPECIES: hypothetical protein [unclassified Nonomuraea]|uniref:hypothetical protein n=1 Tax=unclassified Nonomuraea TaxID=2593643 RepID=UPI0035BF479D
MNPDLYLYVERVRARELRADAERHRLTRTAAAPGPAVRAWEARLGWALVAVGLRLVQRRAVDY